MHLKRLSYILTLMLVLLLTNNYAHGQLPAPRIYLVTVNPETGYDSITWYKHSFFSEMIIILLLSRDPYPGMPDVIYANSIRYSRYILREHKY